MRRFELSGGDAPRRGSWLSSAVLHVTLAVLAVTVAWQSPFRSRRTPPPEVREWVMLPPLSSGPSRPSTLVTTTRRVTIVPQPLPAPPLEVPLRAPRGLSRAGGGGPIVLGPHLADGRPWVSPRPALPADVAEALYSSDSLQRDARVTERLHAMLDSLNQIVDAEQRARRRPSWGTDVAGIPFGLDSQFITIAGIKVPTMALALLGNLLPPGNFEGSLRARQFEDMRQDMLRAAQRTETFRDFQKYVKALRERKQAERDSSRARATPPPDTTRVIP